MRLCPTLPILQPTGRGTRPLDRRLQYPAATHRPRSPAALCQAEEPAWQRHLAEGFRGFLRHLDLPSLVKQRGRVAVLFRNVVGAAVRRPIWLANSVPLVGARLHVRADERRVGKEGVSRSRSGGTTD